MVAFSVNWKSVLGVLVVIIVAVSGASVYMLSSLTPICGTTRTVVYSVSYNKIDNSVFLNLTSWVNKTYVFDEAVIKDSDGQVVASAGFVPTELPAYGTINFTINVGSVVLPSGRSYNIELYTTDGDSYNSVLTIYENVKTGVSLVNANTLMVDIQSFANQTVVFERATINDWVGAQFNPEYMSFISDSVDTTLSQVKLLPNENLSFTILYKRGFSPGNYTFFLYSSSPKSQYVSGAWAFFTVTGMEDCFNHIANIEKITFDDTDNNTLSIDVHSLSNETIVFTGATVKESNGYVCAVMASGNPVPAEVPPYESATLLVSLKTHQGSYANGQFSFGPGNYTVTLNCGENAVWTPFTVPLS